MFLPKRAAIRMIKYIFYCLLILHNFISSMETQLTNGTYQKDQQNNNNGENDIESPRLIATKMENGPQDQSAQIKIHFSYDKYRITSKILAALIPSGICFGTAATFFTFLGTNTVLPPLASYLLGSGFFIGGVTGCFIPCFVLSGPVWEDD
jgi:hypothetical protein